MTKAAINGKQGVALTPDWGWIMIIYNFHPRYSEFVRVRECIFTPNFVAMRVALREIFASLTPKIWFSPQIFILSACSGVKFHPQLVNLNANRDGKQRQLSCLPWWRSLIHGSHYPPSSTSFRIWVANLLGFQTFFYAIKITILQESFLHNGNF